ncbi:MAG: nucleotide sugar epimerase [Chloroflexi bacterium RBG_19FT_COMBO_50_10]|nr:MAG: nucleotide sugar epimerase [Chloroflexi bacterium RBG_16_47_49]OGO66125.1 MAG: nucleotide sugar epimerase [Chloroflexi bacterium RBG_19FT_COMBO_50_10]
MEYYLVTGAAGFIASRVIEMLLDAGHSVVGVDDMNDAYDVRMKEYRLRKLEGYPQFTFHRSDISDRATFDRNSPLRQQSYTAVINLAARAGVRQSLDNPWVYVDANITGTLNLLEYCREQNISKFILASTSSVYGGDVPLPTPETVSSDHPLQAYAATKKGAEALCHVYHYLYGLDVTIFRYFTVYGPAPRPDMVMFRFTQWISEGQTVRVNGDGEQSRGFTFLDDIARGTLLGLKPLGYEIINLGGHEVIKINDLIGMLESLTGKTAKIEHLPRHPADMTTNWANVEKAKQLLGWAPRIGLREGVSRLVDWYNQERLWASQISTT